MIGFLYSLFELTAVGVDNINKSIEKNKNRTRAIENGDLTYYGARGNEYLVDNDKWVHRKTNSSGEKVIADMKTGQVYRNLTQEKIERKNNEQIIKGKTVRQKIEEERTKTYYGKYKQMFYLVDIKTNIPVNEIYINGRYFYQELRDGNLLRIADGENNKDKIGRYSNEEIVFMFNKRQKEMKNELENNKDNNIWLRKNYFFDRNHYIYFNKKKEMKIFWIGSSNAKQEMWKYIKEDLKEV